MTTTTPLHSGHVERDNTRGTGGTMVSARNNDEDLIMATEAVGLGFASYIQTQVMITSNECIPKNELDNLLEKNQQSAQSSTCEMTVEHFRNDAVESSGAAQVLTTEMYPLLDTTTQHAHQTQQMVAAQEGMARAYAVLQKFNANSNHCTQNASDNTITTTTSTSMTTKPSWLDSSPQQQQIAATTYRCLREIDLKRERERLNQALLRNWEYLAKRDEQRLQLRLQQIDQAKLAQQQHKEYHDSLLQTKLIQQQQQQKEGLVSHHSLDPLGVVSWQQRNRKRKASSEVHQVPKKSPKQQRDWASSLYIWNLSATTSMEVIRNVFERYGTIQGVHFYTHKETGEFKGDGLVTYQDKLEDRLQADFLQSICQQLNGCELPCGSVLRVEPANENASSEREKSLEPQLLPTGRVNVLASSISRSSGGSSGDCHFPSDDKDGDEDLDDFFASLT